MKKTFARTIAIASSALLLLGAGCVQVKSGGTAGNDGGVFRSADRGVSWQQKSAVASVGAPKSIGGLNITAISFDPTDSKAVYAGTPDRGLFFSYDGAESWQHASALGLVGVSAVAVSPADKCLLFVGTGRRVVRSEDCGRSWKDAYFDARQDAFVTDMAVDFFNPAVVYAATNKGDFLRSGDNGDSWASVKRFEAEIRQFLMSASDSRVIYVVTRNKGIWKTADGGANWTDLSPNFGKFAGALDNVILAEDVASAGSLLAASNHGLLRSTDGGAVWAAVPLLTPPGSTVIYSLTVNPRDSKAIAYGTINTLYRTVDGGGKWITTKLPTSRAATRLVNDPTQDGVMYMGTTLLQKKNAF
jgi:photosystem II stability/assembly factor-like uncharacterized protein